MSLVPCCLQASTFPTVVVYIMDIVRCVNPVTFMSNILYACRQGKSFMLVLSPPPPLHTHTHAHSILYKTELPFVIVMNKTDIVDQPKFAVEWMNDFEIFQEVLEQIRFASDAHRDLTHHLMCLINTHSS